MRVRVCELCNGEAAIYCASDSAFLCWNCDSKVHGANFLVARHDRRFVCSKCKGFTGDKLSGHESQPFRPICRSCFPESDDLEDSLSSSACVSTTESCATPPKKINFHGLKSDGGVVSSSSVTGGESKFPARFSGEVTSKAKAVRSVAKAKAEGVLVNWCRKLGRSGSCEVVAAASQAFRICAEEMTVLPLRVVLAASLWLSFRLCGDVSASTWQIMKRLEEVSGVPAKLILGAESKLARALKTRKPRPREQHVEEEVEGWAECSV